MTVRVTRRDVLVGGIKTALGVCLAGSSLATAVAGKGAVQTVESQKHPLITVKSVLDPSVAPLLDRLFPGFRESSVYAKLGSVCYVVSNEGSGAANAFTAVWSKSGEHSFEKAVYHYFRPRSHRQPKMHFGKAGNRTRFTAAIPVLRPHSVKILSPFFCWSSRFYKTKGASASTKLFAASRRTTFPVKPSSITAGMTITLTLDAVARRDCAIYGPDKHGLGKLLRSTRNAEHDEAQAILKQQRAGMSSSDIELLLRGHASGTAFNITPKHDLYYRVRQREAKVLLRRFQKARPEQFARTLNYLASRKRTRLHHIA